MYRHIASFIFTVTSPKILISSLIKDDKLQTHYKQLYNWTLKTVFSTYDGYLNM